MSASLCKRFVAPRAITRARPDLVVFSRRIITCLSLQLTWVFHDDEAQINKKLPKELLLRYNRYRLNALRVCWSYRDKTTEIIDPHDWF